MHQVRPILVRDLPVFGLSGYLKIPRRQFDCRNCQHYRTERLEFIDWERHYTRRYEEQIDQRVQSCSIEQVSREEQLSPDVVNGIFEHRSSGIKKKTGGNRSG